MFVTWVRIIKISSGHHFLLLLGGWRAAVILASEIKAHFSLQTEHFLAREINSLSSSQRIHSKPEKLKNQGFKRSRDYSIISRLTARRHFFENWRRLVAAFSQQPCRQKSIFEIGESEDHKELGNDRNWCLFGVIWTLKKPVVLRYWSNIVQALLRHCPSISRALPKHR